MVGAVVWNWVSPNGESIPWPGYLVSGLMVAAVIAIVIVFYVQRYQFIKTWKYRTASGVACYYQSGCTIYLQMDVEVEIKNTVSKWITWGLAQNNGYTATTTDLHDTVCMFLTSGDFYTNDWWHLHVYGATYGNTMFVGQGNRQLHDTAFGHELSHVILNKFKGYQVPDSEAHAIFAQVGV